MNGKVLWDVWGEWLGIQSSQDDRHPPLDALSQARTTDVKPKAGRHCPVSFHSSSSSARTLCQTEWEPSVSLAPGPNALTVPGFAQPQCITLRASPKQHPPWSPDLSLIHREASSPHPEEQEGEFRPGSTGCQDDADARSHLSVNTFNLLQQSRLCCALSWCPLALSF